MRILFFQLLCFCLIFSSSGFGGEERKVCLSPKTAFPAFLKREFSLWELANVTLLKEEVEARGLELFRPLEAIQGRSGEFPVYEYTGSNAFLKGYRIIQKTEETPMAWLKEWVSLAAQEKLPYMIPIFFNPQMPENHFELDLRNFDMGRNMKTGFSTLEEFALKYQGTEKLQKVYEGIRSYAKDFRLKGFSHGHLHDKNILIHPESLSIVFIDWKRLQKISGERYFAPRLTDFFAMRSEVHWADISADSRDIVNPTIKKFLFESKDLRGVRFSSGFFEDMPFHLSLLHYTDFFQGTLNHCLFELTTMRFTSFQGAKVDQSHFLSGIMSHVDFSYSQITRSSFKGNRNLKDRYVMKACSFLHSFLGGTRFEDLDLIDVDFSYSDLRDTKWSNVIFDNPTFFDTLVDSSLALFLEQAIPGIRFRFDSDKKAWRAISPNTFSKLPKLVLEQYGSLGSFEAKDILGNAA